MQILESLTGCKVYVLGAIATLRMPREKVGIPRPSVEQARNLLRRRAGMTRSFLHRAHRVADAVRPTSRSTFAGGTNSTRDAFFPNLHSTPIAVPPGKWRRLTSHFSREDAKKTRKLKRKRLAGLRVNPSGTG
jgi:hypothetical protein